MRFSLKALLLVMLLIAGYLGLWALPPKISAMAMAIVTIGFASVAAGGIIYTRCNAQAFWIGVEIVAGAAVIGLFDKSFAFISFNTQGLPDEVFEPIRLNYAILHACSIASGVTVMGVRWLCLRSQKPPPTE